MMPKMFLVQAQKKCQESACSPWTISNGCFLDTGQSLDSTPVCVTLDVEVK